MSSGPSHLVQILLPNETGNGQPISKDWFDGFVEELTQKFGGATSFLRASGQGLWLSGMLHHDFHDRDTIFICLAGRVIS